MSRRDQIRAIELRMAVEAGLAWHQDLPRLDAKIRKVISRGPVGADDPGRVTHFLSREAGRSAAAIQPAVARTVFGELGLERRFGPTLDYEYLPPAELAQTVGRSVARLVEPSAQGVAPEGFATGFMVSPHLIMTNWHVFWEAASAANTAAQFGYEYRGVLLQEGALFSLRPELYFVADQALDFALIAVDTSDRNGEAIGRYGFVRLIPTPAKILVGHAVNMVGYPQGQPKTYVSKNNPLVDVDEFVLRYLTDSDEGASGSPAFNPVWELVALHHRAVPRIENGNIIRTDGGVWREGDLDKDIDWLANEGIRVSQIISRLKDLAKTQPHELLEELLRTAVDPITPVEGRASATEGESMFSAAPTAPVSHSSPPSFSSLGVPVTGGFVMQFSGPVTINIPPAVAAPVPAARGAVSTVGAEAIIRFDPRYVSRKGYVQDFLRGVNIPLPNTSRTRKKEMLKDGANELVLKYRHFSLAMNRDRRLQMWSAVNVSYSDSDRQWFASREDFGSDKWIPDPRIPADLQLMDPEAYKPSQSLQRGHIVRRDDNAWGRSAVDQEYANSDTFHWTNCTPQHGGFNQSSYRIPNTRDNYQGIWGMLENKIQVLAKRVHDRRLVIFSGPVLDNDGDDAYDWGLGPVQIPMQFWKVICAVDDDGLSSYGFVLDQTQAFKDLGFERLDFGQFKTYQKPLAEIVQLSGVELPDIVMNADVRAGHGPAQLQPGDELRRLGATKEKIKVRSDDASVPQS